MLVALILAAAPQSALELETLQALVLPSTEESSWLNIPWHANLWDARRRAAREGKPILLWEMDGNPLGCT